jgi:predicted acetylornithine/succinylornithine family transaminase
METYKRWPVEFVSGQGCTLVDSQGREYLDLIGGLAVMSVGHSHPKVVAAIAEQSARLTHVSNLYITGPQRDLAEYLGRLTGGFESFFCNSGAEAIECALKLVRRATGKAGIIAAQGGFHGRTTGALAVTGQPAKQEPFKPLLPGVTHVPYDDVAAIEDAMTDEVGAVLLEPIQGEAGVIVPSDDYLQLVRKICDEAGALLVVDEIQTGLGRTGAWFAYEHSDITPDVVCLAKALAGGLPIGVCMARPEIAHAFQPGDHASTFGGGPVPCRAALAVLGVIEQEQLCAKASAAGSRFREGLGGIFGSAATIRGRGLLIGVEFQDDIARSLVRGALDRGVLANDATPRVLRLAPPLVISDAEIDKGLKVIKEVWDEVGAS